MSTAQVKLVLDQVLQTLEFLHQQKFALPMGQVQTGLVHGNLNLNSLVVIKGKEPEFGTRDFIYLCDLSLWEQLFEPFQTEAMNGSVAKDLCKCLSIR